LSRIHSLEEQLRDLEVQGEEGRKEEERRLQNVIVRQERNKSYECDQFITRIYNLQQELLESRQEFLKCENLIERMKQDKANLQSQLSIKQEEIENLKKNLEKTKESVSQFKDQEKVHTKMIQVLNYELEELRKTYTHDFNSVSSSTNSSTSDVKAVLLYNELQQELQKLRRENILLKEANEEIHAQLLANQLEKGRTLLREEEAISSLADELNDLSVEPVSERYYLYLDNDLFLFLLNQLLFI